MKRNALIAAMATVILAVSLVAATMFQFDDAKAMRAATDCVMPLGLVWFTAFFTAIFLFLAKQRPCAVAFLVTWLVLGMIGNSWIARWAIRPLEYPRDPAVLADLTPLRSVILLGGSVSIASDGTAELNSDGQRVMLAAQLWHRGKTRSIICTGSGSSGLADPSTTGRDLLISIGVAPGDIYEIKGRNTTEEMRSLQQFITRPPESFPQHGEIGLITSAFHMPRAMRLANDQTMELVPLPCAHRVGATTRFDPAKLIPTGGAASTLAIACKEWLARLLGR